MTRGEHVAYWWSEMRLVAKLWCWLTRLLLWNAWTMADHGFGR
jgi:hypothetical protein